MNETIKLKMLYLQIKRGGTTIHLVICLIVNKFQAMS